MNIKEIAQLAGVSRATVSRYLNDGYVSEDKKKKIKAVIEITGYKPSATAQMLRSRKTKLIGVIIPKIASESISEMVSGINRVLADNDYKLLLADTENNEEEELKYLDIFRTNQVDGVILIGTIFTDAHYKALEDLEVPVVILGQKIDNYSCVYNDDYSAARDITKALIKERRNDNIGYIGVTLKDKATGYQRQQGFLDALAEEGITHADELDMLAEFTIESGYECAKKLLSINKDVSGIFCATDKIALGAMMYLNEKNVAIPSCIKICGIGDSIYGRTSMVSLSSVHYNYRQGGMEAAKILLHDINNNLDGETGNIQEMKMGYELVLRDSI